jgi:predicted nucleic acid-binding protein
VAAYEDTSASFALMETLGIQRSFNYDADFRKPGFSTIG